MYIYKITNKVNGKIYIGQTYNKTIYDRFERHIHEACSTSKSYLGRAIAKYGRENFVCEMLDDSAKSLQELNELEKYYIKLFNSTNKTIGYNLTDGGDGGNVYKYKTDDELNIIKSKISKANSGKNNGNHFSFKGLNIKTNEIVHFNTITEALSFFNIQNKDIFHSMCNHKRKYYYKNEWVFANENDDFDILLFFDSSERKGTKVKLFNIITSEELLFNSINKLNVYLGLSKGKLKFEDNIAYYNEFIITKVI